MPYRDIGESLFKKRPSPYTFTILELCTEAEMEFIIEKVQEAAEIIVLKNRDGKTGTAHVGFEGVYVRFVEKEITQPLIVEFE